MTNINTQQLVNDLIHNPTEYNSLIVEYINTFNIDIKSINLYDDIQLLVDKLTEAYSTISKKFKHTFYNMKKINKKQYDIVSKKIKINWKKSHIII